VVINSEVYYLSYALRYFNPRTKREVIMEKIKENAQNVKNAMRTVLSLAAMVPVVLFLLGLLSFVGGSVVAALGDGGAAFWLSLVFGGAMAAVACLGLQWHSVITAWILSSKPGTDPLTKLLQYVTLACGWLILVGCIGFFTHTGLLFASANPIIVGSAGVICLVYYYLQYTFVQIVAKYVTKAMVGAQSQQTPGPDVEPV